MVYVDDSGYEASSPKRIPDQSFEQTVTDTGPRRVGFSDPKPPKRIKADPNEWLRLRAAKVGEQPCRLCPAAARDAHHLVPRGMGGTIGGDDVAENLVGLCRKHHAAVEARNPWARTLLGERLTDAERAYVVGKKGAGWLEINYGVKEQAA